MRSGIRAYTVLRPLELISFKVLASCTLNYYFNLFFNYFAFDLPHNPESWLVLLEEC
jgi:hypothetical protein